MFCLSLGWAKTIPMVYFELWIGVFLWGGSCHLWDSMELYIRWSGGDVHLPPVLAWTAGFWPVLLLYKYVCIKIKCPKLCTKIDSTIINIVSFERRPESEECNQDFAVCPNCHWVTFNFWRISFHLIWQSWQFAALPFVLPPYFAAIDKRLFMWRQQR